MTSEDHIEIVDLYSTCGAHKVTIDAGGFYQDVDGAEA
jgi:hypothetical protein